jgi:hypothetical protein
MFSLVSKYAIATWKQIIIIERESVMALYKKDTADVGCRTKPKNPNMRQKWPEFSRSKVK